MTIEPYDIEKEKEMLKEIELKMEMKEVAIQFALGDSRREPGVSLRKIAKICKDVFDTEEIKSLIKELEL